MNSYWSSSSASGQTSIAVKKQIIDKYKDPSNYPELTAIQDVEEKKDKALALITKELSRLRV